MQCLKENEKISIYGNLSIEEYKKDTSTNIKILAENKSVKKIGAYLYNFLLKKYAIFNYEWDNVKTEIKTTKVIVNNKEIEKNCKFKFYGYVEDKGGIPWENGKKYKFHTHEIFFDDLITTIKTIFEDYIVDFDTDETGLKFIITKIEII